MRNRTVIGLVLPLLPLLLIGCWPVSGERAKDVAKAIRASGSEVVDHVDYLPENWLDPAAVDVYLRNGTTDEQAGDFWCRVVIPAGGTGEFVFLWNQDGTGGFLFTATCAP